MAKYPLISIKEIAKIHYGKSLKSNDRCESGSIPVYGSSGAIGFHDLSLVNHSTLIIGRKGCAGKVIYAENGGWPIDTVFYTELIDAEKTNLRYLFYALSNSHLDRWTITTAIPGLSRDDIYSTKIPLPPIEEQRRIAAILDQADTKRRKRREAIRLTEELLRATFLDMFGDPVTNPKGWDVVDIEKITSVKTGRTPSRDDPKNYGGHINWVKTTEVRDCIIDKTEEHLTEQGGIQMTIFPKNSIIVAMYGQGATRGRTALLAQPCTTNQACAVIIPSDQFYPNYLWTLLKLSYNRLRELGRGGNQPNLNLDMIKKFKVQLPPILLQKKFDEFNVKILDQIKKMNESAQLQENLFNSLLQRAFRGEL